MFSPEIATLINEKSGEFIIPAEKNIIIEESNTLMHAFLILTKSGYAKIPVVNAKNCVTGLISLSMITEQMLETDEINGDNLNQKLVQDVMQTDFKVIKLTDDLDRQLHLLVDNAFLPVVDENGVFQGILTRRELIKSFNYVAHSINDKYQFAPKNN